MRIRKYQSTMVTELPYTSVLTHVSEKKPDPRLHEPCLPSAEPGLSRPSAEHRLDIPTSNLTKHSNPRDTRTTTQNDALERGSRS